MKTGQSWGPPLFDYDTLIKYAKLPATHKRYIIIGDVHGQLDDLNKLLKKVSFNMSEDLIILAGDLVNKGQDSLGVVRLAQKIGAKCVRGNHENYLYSIRKEIQLKQPSKKWKDAQVSLTNQMDINDWKYLDSCPLVLELPDLDEKVVVAHAGVDANAPIDDQDPNFTMYVPHMPNLKVANKYYTAHENWQEEWAQKHSQDGMTGVYGHTELKTLDIRPLAKGIDTSCYLGGELTANIYPGDEIVSVKCTDYNKQEKPEATPLLE
ncbi:Metallo-dependent phosphatase-like protein [Dimargaris cristalligena]|uniref:Metallo-dependent phosphatase-like protein n=1 Tax=Dimargaris cristalligena TaxID=215637 RepID=A0A4P9ZUR2_9FUNG|nr:Metallo-dependent phosphatase-like protein [Dimargaris cristalligena]|eukprot:RKP37314.1 Metallo-dependent phosphatase-like protein [Dimargaris cristalligena]